MRIAIDFDDTITALPQTFARLIDELEDEGHSVIIVTCREGHTDNRMEVGALLDHWEIDVPVHFTDLGSKLHYCESRGIQVDIWIDDCPKSLVHGR